MKALYRSILVVFLAASLSGCASFSLAETSWKLRSKEKPAAVRATASFGDTLGFVAFLPISIILMPITIPVVHIFDVGDSYGLLFYPSVKGGELVSILLGAPVDLVSRPFVGTEEPGEKAEEAVEPPARAPPEDEEAPEPPPAEPTPETPPDDTEEDTSRPRPRRPPPRALPE